MQNFLAQQRRKPGVARGRVRESDLMAKERMIALCADDYGLSYGVSVGILEALDAGRLTAVSALVNGPRWPAMGRELLRRAQTPTSVCISISRSGRPLAADAEIRAGRKISPGLDVIRTALRRKLPMDEIRAEIDRQLDRFEAVMERPPDFVDGHQHVHVLPGIRTALLDAMSARRLAGPSLAARRRRRLHRIVLRARPCPQGAGRALARRRL